MANELIAVELTNNTGFPRRYGCTNGENITVGTVCKLIDPRTASSALAASSAIATPIAGVCAVEKEASDGSTSVTLYTSGIFEAVASGAIAVGAPIGFIKDNFCFQAQSGASGAIIAGYSLETASDGETVNVRIIL